MASRLPKEDAYSKNSFYMPVTPVPLRRSRRSVRTPLPDAAGRGRAAQHPS